MFFLAGHLLSYRSLPSKLLGGVSMHSFWNQKAVIWNREHCGISGDFWLKSPQWGSSKSNCHPLRASLQHCSITEPLGGPREHSLTICCLFYFDLTTAVQVSGSGFAILVSLQSDARHTGFGFTCPSSSQRAGCEPATKPRVRIPHRSSSAQSQSTV